MGVVGGGGGEWDVRNTPTYMYATETGISVNLCQLSSYADLTSTSELHFAFAFL